MSKNILWTVSLAFLGLVVLIDPAFANGPVDWAFGFQPAATSSAERIYEFHNLLMIIITGITVFVTLLLIFVVIRYNKHVNKTPSKVTHNVMLEIVWTVLPIVLLIIIAIPSFKILYKNDRIVEPEMTLKITGYQWYWGYEYPDQGGLMFDSRMVATEDLRPDQKRLLSTDNVVVLPIETDIAILVTSNDVIHAWAIPAFGVKIDTVLGRTNETWFRINRVGVYYGQCSELCGKDHSFMPIEVHAVTKEEFEAWTLRAKEEFSANDNMPKNIKLTALQQ
ncbi:MAG: cytochrome c oxidase subunit II [Alphaproteobacteria bacterium]|nr:MAG: cytochrome c oxidase subunit II [Alphaproteobacteria bacterium]